jgi:addiction module HigA family antidote
MQIMSSNGAGSRPRRARSARGGAEAQALPRSLGSPQRMPPHPGQFLQSRFLTPLGLNQGEFAQRLGVSRRRVNELLRGRRAITLDTAVRLARFFGNEAEFWMRLQLSWDIYTAHRKLRVSSTSV